ncbi:DUF551 domain-containing protein [Salmonella enterica subsp. enterica serovar Give]|nr:DUF551 domain-containing protein [Salmonella enterica subsp. enterica serovar Give]ECM4408878.1 DUF551 domain-containing protein [Salmonella enterica subsp. enterica serovar Give]EED4547552.1 DUF551 domain-containing protein [Salmonella enterica subsp. enterica serovar Give]
MKDKQALREAAERAMHDDWGYDTDIFHEQVTPSVVLALLDELDKKQQYIKLRDQENEDIALTVGKLRVELEAAKKRMTEQSAIVAAAEKLVRCKGRYHSELNYRALAKLFGVVTPDLPPLEHENVHYADAAEVEITALRQRIAELESNDGWISCSDRMPEIRQTVIGWNGYAVRQCVYTRNEYAKTQKGREPGFETLTGIWHGVTHWMPLPERRSRR